jgi:hypothetical protein
MTTRKLLCAGCLALNALIWLLPHKLAAQDELPALTSPDLGSSDSVDLVISYGEGGEARIASHRGVFEPVCLLPNQLTPMSLQFSRTKEGMPVGLAPLDGGTVIPMDSVLNIEVSANGIFTFSYEEARTLNVDGDGFVRFGFQSTNTPGLHRVLVQLPGEQHILQFYIIDPNPGVPPVWHR